MLLPNQLTVLRIVLTPVFLFFFVSEETIMKQISVAIFIFAALTDWYDGWLARKYNYITSWGKFWDPLADKVLTSTAFLAFVFIEFIPLWMVIIIIIRDFVITGLRAFADYKEVSFPTSKYAKWKTFFQMSFLYYLLAVYTASVTPQVYNGNEDIFRILLNRDLIYFVMLFLTVITFHSGLSYILKNMIIIRKLFINET